MAVTAVPQLSRAVLQRRDEIIARLSGHVALGRVIHDPSGRAVFAGGDFGTAEKRIPMAVVLPATVREVSHVFRVCYEMGVKVYVRGGATSPTGATDAGSDGIVVCLSRLNRILEVSHSDRLVRVEAGITTSAVSRAVLEAGLLFAPDPSSRMAATVGGNIATDAAGAGALRNGPTSAHVTALKVVLIDGETVELGDGELEAPSLGLMGVFAGAEGLAGAIVEATLSVVPAPEEARLHIVTFPSVTAAVQYADRLMTERLDIAALKMADRRVLSVCRKASAIAAFGDDYQAALFIEFDGTPEELDASQKALPLVSEGERFDLTAARDVADVWRSLDGLFAALARLGPLRGVDVIVPRRQQVEVFRRLDEIAANHGLSTAHLGRVGEGVIRSVLIAASPNSAANFDEAMSEVAGLVAEIGGIFSGEHGIGRAKCSLLDVVLTEKELAMHGELKSFFDAEWLLGYGTVLPVGEG